ncbi:DUF4007 family protein [Reichenbachiella sp.]
MSVYFHGSFGLNRIYMSGILTALLKSPNASPEQLAVPFGYQAPFAQKYRTWLVKTGILKSSRQAELTTFGEVIWSNDPKLQNTVTKWFMHHQLTFDQENAEAWHFFVQSFLQKNRTFTKEDLQNQLAMKMMPHSDKHFRKGSPMNTRISNKLIECYTKTEALGDLGVVTIVDRHKYQFNNPKILGPWNDPATLAKSYGN